MMKHIWSLLCRKSVIDQETKNLSVYDILEQLTIDVKIKKDKKEEVVKVNIPIEYEVISFWSKEKETAGFKGKIKLEIISPIGEVKKTFEQPLEIPKDKRRLRSRFRIKGFIADLEGIYLFRISHKEKKKDRYIKMSEVPFEVFLKKEFVENLDKNKPLQEVDQ